MFNFDQKASAWVWDPISIFRCSFPSDFFFKEAAFSKKQRLPFADLVSWEKVLCSNFAIFSEGIWDLSAPIPVPPQRKVNRSCLQT